ncbi:MAG: SCO1664 family protein [Actinomycetota bacterium]
MNDEEWEDDEYDDEYEDESRQEAPIRERDPIPNEIGEKILAEGEVEVLGQMPWSSNTTLLCDVRFEEHFVQAIYKPHRGERPLWDFPSGLYKREVACYELAKAVGWDLVPPTVLIDGPVGMGSIQLFVPCDFTAHYLTLNEEERFRPTFERLVAFDMVANSTDRKAGHVLLDRQDHIWAIDNGLSFHEEFKLRTVLWDYAGEPIPEEIVEDLQALVAGDTLADALGHLIDEDELEAADHRARILINEGRFPVDHSGRRWPWPLV